MRHQVLLAATLLAATASTGKHFHIGPWIIVPILILAAIIAIPVYILRDRRKRQEINSGSERPRTSRRR